MVAVESRAIAYAEKNRIGEFTDKGEFKPFPLNVDLKKLDPYGLGLRLYFEFMKFFILVFLVMSILALPPIYSNYFGDGLDP